MAVLNRLVESALPLLQPDEQVRAAVEGTVEHTEGGGSTLRHGLLLVTDRRLVFTSHDRHGGSTLCLDLDEVRGVRIGTTVSGDRLVLDTARGEVAFRHLWDPDAVRELLAVIGRPVEQTAAG